MGTFNWFLFKLKANIEVFAQTVALIGIGVSLCSIIFSVLQRNHLSVGISVFFILNYAFVMYCLIKKHYNLLLIAQIFLTFNICMGFSQIVVFSVLFYNGKNNGLFLGLIAVLTLYAIFSFIVVDKTRKYVVQNELPPQLYSNEQKDDETSMSDSTTQRY